MLYLSEARKEKGPGIFRENPALLNHPNYKTLINIVIRFSVINDIKQRLTQIWSITPEAEIN